MEEKEKYTPEEVARMCQAYRSVCGGLGGPVKSSIITNYEETVPKNVRDIINNLNQLEKTTQQEALKKI